jgi:hypothetical protein
MIEEAQIRHHWESSSVDENIAGSLYLDFGGDHEAFFNAWHKVTFRERLINLNGKASAYWKSAKNTCNARPNCRIGVITITASDSRIVRITMLWGRS